jgi:glycosyltransferase involved in cell wall biosynthesis
LKPRLLIILNRLVVGGQSIDTVPLTNYLKNDYDILIVYGEKENDEIEFTDILQKANGISFQKIASLKRNVNLVSDVKVIFSLCSLIKKFKPIIIHTHGTKPGVVGRLAAWLTNVPVIIHTFHGHLFHSYYNKPVSFFIVQLEKLLGRISSKIIVLSKKQHEEICERYKIVRKEKVALIPLGVNEKDYNSCAPELRSKFRHAYQLSENCVAVGIIGRIVPVKNLQMFVEVIVQLMQSSVKEHVKVFFVGDGYSKRELQNILSQNKIEWSQEKNNRNAEVIFTSWVTPITAALHGFDIVALTSLNEGTPMSLIEAQICGKPVVATDAGGVADTFLNNESGFLVKDYDINEFTNKLLLLIQNNELRKKMGEKGRWFAKEKFSKETEVKAFRTLYSECITSASKQ